MDDSCLQTGVYYPRLLLFEVIVKIESIVQNTTNLYRFSHNNNSLFSHCIWDIQINKQKCKGYGFSAAVFDVVFLVVVPHKILTLNVC